MAILSAIGEKARQSGELVYGYQQGDADYNYKDIGPWGEVRNGYCAALGFKWIGLRLRNEDLEYSESTRLAKKEDWRITRLHNLTKIDGYDSVLAELGLSRGTPRTFLGIPSELQIVPYAASATGCYMIQYKRAGGGHLVAIQNEAPRYRYFDANFGEFAFRSKDRFQTWFGEFLVQSGYRNRYTVSAIVTPVSWSNSKSVSSLRQRFGG